MAKKLGRKKKREVKLVSFAILWPQLLVSREEATWSFLWGLFDNFGSEERKESEKRGDKEIRDRLLGEERRPEGLSLYLFLFFLFSLLSNLFWLG